jgi:hypothetical protein
MINNLILYKLIILNNDYYKLYITLKFHGEIPSVKIKMGEISLVVNNST